MTVRRLRTARADLARMAEPLRDGRAKSAVLVWVDADGVSAHAAHVEAGRDVVGLVAELHMMAVRLGLAVEDEAEGDGDAYVRA